MFGHVGGAFTDARTSQPGLFEAASGGTLLLDEIAELSLAAQAKRWRSRHLTRCGSTEWSKSRTKLNRESPNLPRDVPEA
jgi:transcriptional regulator with GAF, ATPase, and Fis domain